MSKNAKQQLRKAQQEARATKPKPRRGPALDLEGHLRAIVTECLGGPGGDPDDSHMLAAAHAFSALRSMGVKLDDDTERGLRGDNGQGADFLALVGE